MKPKVTAALFIIVAAAGGGVQGETYVVPIDYPSIEIYHNHFLWGQLFIPNPTWFDDHQAGLSVPSADIPRGPDD